jgi:hypothetical protein
MDVQTPSSDDTITLLTQQAVCDLPPFIRNSGFAPPCFLIDKQGYMSYVPEAKN